jgi:putative pyruvate formate lyase activating enzyme
MSEWRPPYLALHASGELREPGAPWSCWRVVASSYPRLCKVDRLADRPGLCRVGRHAVVASHFPHFDEEDCLRGRRGSGTIFFSGCNLRCVFCQNHDIS